MMVEVACGVGDTTATNRLTEYIDSIYSAQSVVRR